MTEASVALELANIHKRFGTLSALADVSLSVRAGEVHAVLGENGAGKTTLMRIAFGMLRPDRGTVRVAGNPVALTSPADAIAAGIGMVHQHFTLVPTMTVGENISLGGKGLLRRARVRGDVRRVAEETGFALDADARVSGLGVGAQQRVEIAKAMVRDATVLILDEPTAVLAPAEAHELMRLLRGFAEAGKAIVIITHKLREALSVADSITVLRRGRLARQGPARDETLESLTVAMLGASMPGVETRSPLPPAGERRIVVDARSIHATPAPGHADVHGLREASFTLHAGEIVGVAAVEGSGQHTLLRVIAGRLAVERGSLVTPEDTGFIPEDRHEDAMLLDRPLVETVALRGAGARRGRMPWRALRARAHALIAAFDVRAPAPDAPMRTLSGGNQQKLVLGRELLGEAGADGSSRPPPVVVAENPTRGLDVRAAAMVRARLLGAARDGSLVVFYSSDLDEVLSLSTRVLVVHAGTVSMHPPDRDRVGRAMLGIP